MIELRKATSYKDCETIEELAREILPEAYGAIINDDLICYLLKKSHSAKAIDDHISNKNYEYYLIKNSDKIVGYLGVELISEAIIISKLYILKTFRGKGIGAIAMSFVNKIAQRSNVLKIELTVHKQNKKSINFYLKNGFIITDSLFHEFENGHSLQGYQMIKVLKK